MKENKIQKLSDREHILLRPNMYAGAVEKTQREMLINDGDRFVYQTVEYVPALVKIIEEVIDNAVDEAIRTDFKHANNIKIKYDKRGYFHIEDNGRGVPQTKNDDGVPGAVVAFTEAKSGSNFSSETKANGIGTNGVGSYICNVFSNEFIVETSDGKNKLTLECSNNASFADYRIKKSDKPAGTHVKFKPDLERFGIDKLDDSYFKIIENRLYHLAQSFPDITFQINY